MSRSLSQTGEAKRRFSWPTGTPQIVALLLVLLVDSLVAPHFFQIVVQDGRLFGSPIDILNRAAPVALLAIGMTLVIATGGIDLSVGAVMAIAGATAASMTVAGHSLPVVLLAALGSDTDDADVGDDGSATATTPGENTADHAIEPRVESAGQAS